MLCIYTLGHAFILDDVPALLCCGVLPHFKYQPVREPLVQEIVSNLVFAVPLLCHLYLCGGWVVQILGDRAQFRAIEVAPSEIGLHGILKTELKNGPVLAFRVKAQNVSGQLLNVMSRVCK